MRIPHRNITSAVGGPNEAGNSLAIALQPVTARRELRQSCVAIASGGLLKQCFHGFKTTRDQPICAPCRLEVARRYRPFAAPHPRGSGPHLAVEVPTIGSHADRLFLYREKMRLPMRKRQSHAVASQRQPQSPALNSKPTHRLWRRAFKAGECPPAAP